MSAPDDKVREIAGRVARRVLAPLASPQSAPPADHPVDRELAEVRSSLGELARKVAHIETHFFHPSNGSSSAGELAASASAPRTQSPWLATANYTIDHPSQERFPIDESAVAELVDFLEGEKTCEIEPGGRKCDHCAQCSTRGF